MINLTSYKENNCYNVKGYNYNQNIICQVFDTLKEARKFLKQVIKTNKIITIYIGINFNFKFTLNKCGFIII